MKKITSIILTTTLVFGYTNASHAYSKNTGASSTAGTDYNIQKVYSEVETDRLLNNARTLLEKSSVSNKLKNSINPADRAQYTEAMETLKKAESARSVGNYKEAEDLAIETARVIAKAMPGFHKHISNTRKL